MRETLDRRRQTQKVMPQGLKHTAQLLEMKRQSHRIGMY